MKPSLLLALILAWAHPVAGRAEEPVLKETPAQKEARLRWWREARFGLFLHWGPVSLTGREISWSRANSNTNCPNHGPTPVAIYDNLYREFNPTNFDAREWVRLARDAGMKYIVLTAKHCDGFCLWHTRAGDYHIGNSPFRRDVCGELAAAAHRAGVRIGWYYSPMDWRDPDCRTERNAAYVKRMQTHLRELLTNYGRIDLLWFDWDGGTIPWDQENTYRLVRACQPRIVLNNRLDALRGERAADRYLSPNADYLTPEQKIGAYDDQRPWETCMTLGTQWAWKPNDQIKSPAEVIRILVQCAGGDGNLLLNVGPIPDGRIEPRQAEVLRAVGAWLRQYGQSIYRTRGGPWKPGDYGASTRSGRTVFVHAMRWQQDTLRLPPIQAKVLSAQTLTGAKAHVRQDAQGLCIRVAPADRDPIDTIIALRLNAPAMNEPALSVP